MQSFFINKHTLRGPPHLPSLLQDVTNILPFCQLSEQNVVSYLHICLHFFHHE